MCQVEIRTDPKGICFKSIPQNIPENIFSTLRKSFTKDRIATVAPMCHKFLPHFELFHKSFYIRRFIF